MKLRSTLLACVCLLLMGSLVHAAAPDASPAAPANEAVMALFADEKPADCPTADLPFLAPAPTDKTDLCGPCSVTSCQGKNVNSVCRYVFGGDIYTCVAYQACSDGATRQCGCYRFVP